ncbi:MAG: SAM-dependent methyltransferase [Gammaproteobacteria bacterium]|nr:SAM-dependent methyltransferase [Gammaproteobacteria bacterium]MDH5651420.1 SAM-dependent methyltransferase [Gammaproteobacteria bacterium]
MLEKEREQYFDYTSVSISDAEYLAYKKLIYEVAGISLHDKKKPLLTGRLSKRLRFHSIKTYTEYLELVKQNSHELQMMIDLVSTNETSFFREEKHFEFLQELLPTMKNRVEPFRVWSAACSSGQEAYTTAMVIDNVGVNFKWDIVGTDISTRILAAARKALYPINAADRIPREYLVKYCRKGVRDMTGTFLIDKNIRSKVKFEYINLNAEPWPNFGEFDVIFLRNVMIYFDAPTKNTLVNKMVERLKPGGYLFIGHSESLLGIKAKLKSVRPAIYQKK